MQLLKRDTIGARYILVQNRDKWTASSQVQIVLLSYQAAELSYPGSHQTTASRRKVPWTIWLSCHNKQSQSSTTTRSAIPAAKGGHDMEGTCYPTHYLPMQNAPRRFPAIHSVKHYSVKHPHGYCCLLPHVHTRTHHKPHPPLPINRTFSKLLQYRKVVASANTNAVNPIPPIPPHGIHPNGHCSFTSGPIWK